MRLISHRGNLNGPNKERENHPDYIWEALQAGFEVEIDVWWVNGKFILGHDEPQYKIDHNWLDKRRNYLWLHCKNIEAAKECWAYHSFCHSSDPFTYTSTGKIWLHDLEQTFDDATIIPLLDWEMVDSFKTHIKNEVPYGICTDYPHML